MNLQKGNLYLIIAIIVGVVAIGATGFASWKYFGGGSELEKESKSHYFQPSYLQTVPQVKKQEEIKKEEIISSKKTNETADWKTYRSDRHNYEIKYPKDWFLTENEFFRVNESPSMHVIISTYPFSAGDNLDKGEYYNKYAKIQSSGVRMRIETRDAKNYSSLKKYLQKEMGHLERPMFDIKIAGSSAIKESFQKDEIIDEIASWAKNCYFILKGKNVYIIGEFLGNRITQKEQEEYLKTFNQILSTFRFINPVADYFESAELQYENDSQRKNIADALNDILILSEEQLKIKKYKDSTGKENQWDLPTLIYRHFVPEYPGVTLGDNFYHDVKSVEAQKQIKQIMEKYF